MDWGERCKLVLDVSRHPIVSSSCCLALLITSLMYTRPNQERLERLFGDRPTMWRSELADLTLPRRQALMAHFFFIKPCALAEHTDRRAFFFLVLIHTSSICKNARDLTVLAHQLGFITMPLFSVRENV